MAATKRKRLEMEDGRLQCCACKRLLPRDAFLIVTIRDKRCKPDSERTTPSFDCRECRKEQRRLWRARKANEAGKAFEPRGDREAYEAQQRLERGRRKLARRVAWAICRAFRVLTKMTRRQTIERIVARQRRRRHEDQSYWAERKALKLRRKYAIDATQVERVSIEVVAERDHWTCSICRGAVTRRTWSMDHVIPLSKGGPHTYDNVRLAHRGCNSAKGAKMSESLGTHASADRVQPCETVQNVQVPGIIGSWEPGHPLRVA